MTRAKLLGIAALVVLAGSVVGGRMGSIMLIDRVLVDRGLSWEAASHGPLSSTWSGMKRAGLRVDRAELLLLPRPLVHLHTVDVQLGEGEGEGPAAGGDPGGITAPALQIEVDDLTVRAGEEVLAEGLAGTLSPTLALSGPGTELTRQQGVWQAEVSRPLALGPATGTLILSARTVGQLLDFDARVPDLVLEHPLLASHALPPATLSLRGTWSRSDGQLEAKGAIGGLSLELGGTVGPTQRKGSVIIGLAGELTDVVALFGDLVPEAGRASCQGTVGLRVELSGPPSTWRATPSAEGLTCTGLLVDVGGLKSGAVTWKARSADGTPVLARTGPAEPGFTGWMDGRRVAEAMVASEDVAFLTHPGFDLSAIQEALDEAAEGDPRPRGGSTLTQQLAKNLFLDGERTLARKLRELLYALNLEAELDKRHILQLYINIVELGPDLHGVGAAADVYFAKRPAGLTDKEAAFLATLLPSPTTGHEGASRGRFSEARVAGILDNMALAGLREREQVERAKRQPLVILISP